MLKIIKSGHVFNPDDIGCKDILIAGEQIIEVKQNIPVPSGVKVEVIDAKGKTVVPGFIDGHVHLLGGGGSEGPASHTHGISFSSLAMAGITTVVGTLGLDCINFDIKHLLIKAKELEENGITTYIYTGSFNYPSPTIMGSIELDLSMIEKVIGVKLALFDALSSQISEELFSELIGKARVGGMLGKKSGIVHIHLGDVSGDFKIFLNASNRIGVPLKKIVITHINRSREVFKKALNCAKQGLVVDVTALSSPARGINKAVRPAQAIKELIEAGVPLENITMSSDSNAAQIIKSEKGELEKMFLTPVNVIIQEFKEAVTQWNLPFSDVLKIVTINVAKVLGIERFKGSILPGKHADLILMDDDLNIDTVMAKGKILVKDSIPVLTGKFEMDYYYQSQTLRLKLAKEGGGK